MEGAGAMKREIVCLICYEQLRKVLRSHPADPEGPAEFVKFVRGEVRSDMRCDQCGKEITKDSKCAALSMWTEFIPYSQWERDYIKKPGP